MSGKVHQRMIGFSQTPSTFPKGEGTSEKDQVISHGPMIRRMNLIVIIIIHILILVVGSGG